MEVKTEIPQEVYLTGDINNLVQVMNNLVNNAIDAEREAQRKEIVINIEKDDSSRGEESSFQTNDYQQGHRRNRAWRFYFQRGYPREVRR